MCIRDRGRNVRRARKGRWFESCKRIGARSIAKRARRSGSKALNNFCPRMTRMNASASGPKVRRLPSLGHRPRNPFTMKTVGPKARPLHITGTRSNAAIARPSLAPHRFLNQKSAAIFEQRRIQIANVQDDLAPHHRPKLR